MLQVLEENIPSKPSCTSKPSFFFRATEKFNRKCFKCVNEFEETNIRKGNLVLFYILYGHDFLSFIRSHNFKFFFYHENSFLKSRHKNAPCALAKIFVRASASDGTSIEWSQLIVMIASSQSRSSFRHPVVK